MRLQTKYTIVILLAAGWLLLVPMAASEFIKGVVRGMDDWYPADVHRATYASDCREPEIRCDAQDVAWYLDEFCRVASYGGKGIQCEVRWR